MKKLFILLTLLLMVNTASAQEQIIQHKNKEANFQLKTNSHFNTLDVFRQTTGKQIVSFGVLYNKDLAVEKPLAIGFAIIDASRDPAFKQAAEDFKKIHASQEYREQFAKELEKKNAILQEYKIYTNPDKQNYVVALFKIPEGTANLASGNILSGISVHDNYQYIISIHIADSLSEEEKELLNKSFYLILDSLKPLKNKQKGANSNE